MAEKSILEQALLQVETLEEALKQNAKGILGSVVKQELNSLLRETEEEGDEVTNPKEEVEDVTTDEQSEEDTEDEMDSEEESDDMDSEESDEDSEDMDSDDMGSDDMDSDDMGSDDMDSDDMGSSDDDVMDMTGASDDEVLKVFKAMKPEDGIVVKKDGNNLDIEIDGEEYVIKLDELEDESESGEMEEMSDMEETLDEEEMMDGEEETVYEIELDDEADKTETKEGKTAEPFGKGVKKVEAAESKVEAPYKATKGAKKVEATEAARTKWNPHGDKGEAKRAGLKSKKMFKAGSGTLNEEVTKLRKQNDEYKKALVLFKEKLNEVAVFNASLAYATRLFTEHSTTKTEKLNILKRFDSVSTMNESKNLYKTIASELTTKKPVTESVAQKISTMPTSSAPKEVLAEAKVYENEQFKRVKELMAKIK
jgi:hypothetical protein